MIYNFRSKDAESIWYGDASGPLPVTVQHLVRRKLRMLNSARGLDDLRAYEEIDGRHSLRIDNGARLVFRWQKRGAKDVELAP